MSNISPEVVVRADDAVGGTLAEGRESFEQIAMPAASVVASKRPTIASDVRDVCQELWQYRELLQQFTLRELRVRYKQSAMGFAWALFMPCMIVVSGLIVKFAMSQIGSVDFDKAAMFSMAIKALPWAFFVGAINFATPSLVQNQNLVTRIYFPREVCPLASVFVQCVDTAVGAVLLLAMLWLAGIGPYATWVWMLCLAPLVLVLTIVPALALSCANLFFRDVRYIVQVLLMFGIFFTPVFVEPAMLGPIGSKLLMLNPLSPVLEGLRLCLVEGHNLAVTITAVTAGGAEILVWSPWHLVYSAAFAGVGLVASAVVFHRSEFLFAEYV